jgi:uncharacterized protein YbaP (TraB family)
MYLRFKALAALMAGLLVLVATPSLAQPAMWVIRDPDSTIYLFGTVHVLKKDTVWKSPRMEAALASADELWLELDDTDDTDDMAAMAAMQALVARLGMDPDNALSGRLSGAEKARYDAALARAGVPAGALDGMKPWMAGLALSVLPLMQAGYDPSYGVDGLLKAEARVAGRTVRAFETSERQLGLFDSLPMATQIEFLMTSVDDMDETSASLDSLVANWASGNIKGLEEEMVSPMRKQYPGLYKVLLTDRNTAWAAILAERLKGKGVSFVAVGSAHLVGRDSLQAQLARRGIASQRY